MSNHLLRFHREDEGIASLTLERPEVGNSINLELASALVDAAVECDADERIRCVTLTGAGRFFCTGGDIHSLASAGDNRPAFLTELTSKFHEAVSRFARMRKPLVVLVNGPAAGAGLSLAMLGDLVLAARSAHFTAAYTSVGLTPDGGVSWLLPRLVGLRKAQEMLLTNVRVPADEAETIGLVTRTVPDADLVTEGRKSAEALSHAAVSSIGVVRALLLDAFKEGLEGQMEKEGHLMAAAGGSVEGEEGIEAFLSKRSPNFRGA